MSELINTYRFNLRRSISMIANQEIPVIPTHPVYSLFGARKEIAMKVLGAELNSQEEEMLLDAIEMYNSNIKKYLGL